MCLTVFSTREREMFQPKYCWVEIKYLGAMQNRRRHLFAFSQYMSTFAVALPRADVN